MILHVTLQWQRQKVYQIDIRITTDTPYLSVMGELWAFCCGHLGENWPHFNSTKCMLMNSSPPSAAYMRQWTGSSLVQVVACRLFGAKPLPEPMLVYYQLDSWKHITVKFGILSLKKMQLKMPSVKMAAILSRGRWVNHLLWRSLSISCQRECKFLYLDIAEMCVCVPSSCNQVNYSSLWSQEVFFITLSENYVRTSLY